MASHHIHILAIGMRAREGMTFYIILGGYISSPFNSSLKIGHMATLSFKGIWERQTYGQPHVYLTVVCLWKRGKQIIGVPAMLNEAEGIVNGTRSLW